jgi:hypothetical protein
MSTYKIIEDETLVDNIKSQWVRTWHERLFTLPWRPWDKYKTVEWEYPNMVLIEKDQTVICHPVVAKILRKHFPEKFL